MRVRFIEAGGHHTRILTAGEGHPLFLLHGVGLSADSFVRNIEALGREMSVIAIDMVGHGFTDGVALEGAPQPVLVDHVLAVADALGIERFAVAGSSFGAQIATLTHLKAPERVNGLCIIGSGSTFNTEDELLKTLSLTRANAMKALADPTWESCATRLQNLVHSPDSVPDEIILSQLTSYARPSMKQWYEDTLNGMTNMDLARPHRVLDRLEEISCPTLIIWGKQDTRGDYRRAVAEHKRIPISEIVLFDDCGHLPYVEHPQEFNQALIDFWKRMIVPALAS